MLAAKSGFVSSPRQIKGKVVLVAGTCDPENEMLVRDLLRAGATVVWPSMVRRAPEPRLHVPQLDVRKSRDVAELQSYCERNFDGLDAVVVNFGDHDSGPKLAESSVGDFEGVVTGRLFSHLLLARTFTPVLAHRPESAYIFVNDSNAYSPGRGGGLRSAAAAAELALAESLAFEMGGKPHVYSLVVSTSSSGSCDSSSLAPECLAEAVSLIVSDPGYAKNQTVIQGGWREILDPAAQSPDYNSCL